ncbi:MAG TPA: hypothetical protein VD969_18875 [Symbiobacteriaceae bacterium]|nr:hypothetical protein [Symbiobacteriaceae bacterium]
MTTPEFPKSIHLALAALEEVTLAFGPHPSGILAIYMPVEVPTDEVFVQHLVFPTPDKPGAPIIELIKIKPLKLLQEPVEFKILHKQGEMEEIITVTVKTLLLTHTQV